MDKEKVEFFKKLLEQERNRIRNNATNVIKTLTDQTQDFKGDEADEAMALSDAHISFRFLDREKQFLDKIEETLIKIKKGTFGLCEDCGEDIGIRRLEIRPIATLCINCKEEQEKSQYSPKRIEPYGICPQFLTKFLYFFPIIQQFPIKIYFPVTF